MKYVEDKCQRVLFCSIQGWICGWEIYVVGLIYNPWILSWIRSTISAWISRTAAVEPLDRAKECASRTSTAAVILPRDLFRFPRDSRHRLKVQSPSCITSSPHRVCSSTPVFPIIPIAPATTPRPLVKPWRPNHMVSIRTIHWLFSLHPLLNRTPTKIFFHLLITS